MRFSIYFHKYKQIIHDLMGAIALVTYRYARDFGYVVQWSLYINVYAHINHSFRNQSISQTDLESQEFVCPMILNRWYWVLGQSLSQGKIDDTLITHYAVGLPVYRNENHFHACFPFSTPIKDVPHPLSDTHAFIFQRISELFCAFLYHSVDRPACDNLQIAI